MRHRSGVPWRQRGGLMHPLENFNEIPPPSHRMGRCASSQLATNQTQATGAQGLASCASPPSPGQLAVCSRRRSSS